MSVEQYTIKQIIDNPSIILNEDDCWGFYDWFCKDNMLEYKEKDYLVLLKKYINLQK